MCNSGDTRTILALVVAKKIPSKSEEDFDMIDFINSFKVILPNLKCRVFTKRVGKNKLEKLYKAIFC